MSVAAIALAACTDRSTTTPTAPASPIAPRGDVSVAALATLACDFTLLKADIRDLAASNKDVLFTIVGDLQALSKNGPNAAATDKVFDGLSRLAAMRGTSAIKTGVLGAVFDRATRRLLGCAEGYVVANAEAADFSGALAPGWMFEVRGKTGVDPETGAYERGSTGSYWAAEAGGATWGSTLLVTAPAGVTATNRALIYGFRRTDFFTNDPKAGSAFEHRTIPVIGTVALPGALSLVPPGLKIGLCNVDVNNTLRVQHVTTVLAIKTLGCDTPPAFVPATTSTSTVLAALNPASIARRAIGIFTPQLAYAAFAGGSVGGAVSELSPSAVIDMQQVTLKFVFPIVDGNNSTALKGSDGAAVKVLVTTKGGTPLPNVTVTLAVAGNNSVIAYFSDNGAAATPTVSRPTGTNGVATFTGVSLTKAGGYQLVATGTFDGVAGQPVTSNSFNIQNK
jgi:hypothetical protein